MENKFKRFLSLTLALLMIIGMVPVNAQAAESDTTVYLDPGCWNTDNAWFAAYYWNDGGNNWVKLTDEDGDGIYEGIIPAGYTSIIFNRMAYGNDALDWSNKWNQTNDLTISGNNNLYTITGWEKENGTWSHKHVPGEEATCTTHQVCTVCDEVLTWTEGHQWVIGDESVCSVCQKVCEHLDKGEHGTCADCKICLHKEHDVNGKCYCGLELGAAAHQWGMPGTCDVCGATHETHGGEWTWEVPGEDYGSRRCSICGIYHYHEAWDEYFMCTECGAPCNHAVHGQDNACVVCGVAVDHTYVDSQCTVCGKLDIHSHTFENGILQPCVDQTCYATSHICAAAYEMPHNSGYSLVVKQYEVNPVTKDRTELVDYTQTCEGSNVGSRSGVALTTQIVEAVLMKDGEILQTEVVDFTDSSAAGLCVAMVYVENDEVKLKWIADDHSYHWEIGTCAFCDIPVEHVYTDGYCSCGAVDPNLESGEEGNEGEAEACEHDWGNDNDGICNLCQAECKHPEHNSELYPYCTTCKKGLEHSYGEDNTCACGSKAVAQMLKDDVLSKSADVFHLLANSGGTATVTLLADAAVEMEQTLTVSGTLDLNGHTLAANIVINSGANFIVQDNSEAKSGKIVGNLKVKKDYSVGVLRLESGAIEGNITVENGWLYISGGHVDGQIVKAYDGGILEITGGTFTSEPSADFLKQADGSCNGYKAVKDEATGIWTVVEKQAPVASINGSVWFETLQAAIDAAVDGDYIWLERDVTLAQNTGLTVDNKKITLDLQGYTISSNINGEEICGTIRIGKNGDLTIKGNDNGAVKNEAEMTDDGYSSIALLNYGKLTVEGGTFVGGNALYNGSYGYADTEAVLKGGSFESTDIYEVSVANCANLTVEGATIKNWLSTSGKLEVKSGEIENLSVTNADAAVASGIGTTISGGDIQLLDMTSLSNGKYANAVTVTDGSVNAVEVYVQDGATVKATLAISEGYHGAIACYTYDENYAVTESDENLGVAISGGRFTADPSAYVAGGYKATMSEYGYWEIVEKLPAVAAVNGVEYETLQAAINAVRTDAGPLDHDTVTLLQNVTEIVNIHEKYLTLDLNGFTLSGNPSAGQGVINVSGMGTQVITNGTIQNTGTEGVGLLLDDPVASSDYVALKDVSIEGVEYGIYTKRHTQNSDGSLTLRATADNGIAFYGTYRGTLVTWGSDNSLVEGNAYAIKIEDYTPQDPQMKGGILCGTFRGSIEIPKDYFAIRGGSFTEDPSDCLSEGYVANLVDGMYVVTKEVTYVAQIVGGESYETLQAAIDAAQAGDTVKLLADVKIVESMQIDKSITLDLNGKTIYNETEVQPALLWFCRGAEIEVTNGAITSTNSAIRVEGATVTLSSIEVSGIGNAIYVDGNNDNVSTVTIGDGAIVSAVPVDEQLANAIQISGDTATLNVLAGAEVSGLYCDGISVGYGATATIAAGASVAGGGTAVTVSSATLVTEGNLSGDFAIEVHNSYGSVVQVKGGEISAMTACISGYCFEGYTKELYVTVEGGTFYGPIGTAGFGEGFNYSISGGSFNFDPSDFLAEGYVATQQENGMYVVAEGEPDPEPVYVAQVGETKYESVQAAINAAEEGAEILLLTDVSENVTANKVLRLTPNGFTFSGEISAEGFRVYHWVEGRMWLVLPGDSVVFEVLSGYKGYPSIQAAVDASEGVCILNLIQDVNEVVTVGEGVILGGLSLNGFTLSGAPTSKDQGVLNINGNVGGSINNGSIINTGTMGAAIVLNNTSNSSGEDLNGVQGDVNIQGVDAGIITNTRVGFWRNIHVSATAENGIGVLVKQGGSLITYNHNGCSITGKGAAVKVESGAYENPSYIGGGTIDGALSFGEGATVNVVGGTYTVDPSAYVAEGYVATYDAANKWYTVSQKQVVEDVKPEELPGVKVEDKDVSVSVSGTESKTEIKEEVKTELENSGVNNETIQQAANNTQTATSLVQAAAKVEQIQKDVQKAVEDNKTVIDEVFAEDEDVEVEIRPYLDMTITDFKPAEETGTATLKLSIEAKYDVVAVGEKKEAVLESGKTMETVQKDITITIPLPEGFVTEGKVLKIKHSKNGVQKGIYDATVSADGKTATFVNPNGFSEFEAYTEDAPTVTGVAKIGNQSYDTLQAAIDAVKNGETIELLQNVTENVTLTQKTGLSYTVDGNNKTLTGKIVIKTDSTQSESKRTVIKNLNFVSDAKVDFISSTDTNHYPVITVEGCTFTGNGKNEAVAIRLKSSQSVIIKDCVGTGLHSFLQNTSGWDMTIENVTVTDSKSGFAMGTAQNSLVKDCKITASDVGYGIRYDAENNTTNTVQDCEVTAFIPVVIRKASVNNTIVIEGTNKMTAKNADGLWAAMGTSEYEENGTMPTAATGRIILTVNDAELNQNEAGVYGHEAHIGNKFYTAKPEGTLAVGVVTDDAAKANDSFIYFDITKLTAYESIEIKLYAGETLLSSTVLNEAGIGKGYLDLNALGANIELTKNSSSWDTTWAVAPRYNLVPNKAVLYVDGIEQNTVNEIRMYNTDNPALKREWIDVEGVGFIEVDNTDGTETWHGTLADALSAAKDGAVITLHDVDKVIDANGEVTGGKTVTITGKATFNWQAGWLFVGRGNNPGDGKLIFDNATITSSAKKNPATYGVYVSGAKADGSTANGAVVIKNSSIELDYLRNQNTVEIDNSTLTVYGGYSISGRKSSEAAGGVDATATIDIKNGSTVNVLNENGMGIGYEGNGVVILKDSTFKSKSITLYGDGGKSYFDVYGKSTIDVKFNSKETKAVNYGLVYLNGVDFDANTKITGKVRVRAASGTNNIDGSTIDAPFFQVGIGAYNGQDPKVDTVNGVTVNVKNNAVISAGGSTYAGWVGTGYYDTDAEKAAAMTDAKYVLNIENSQASFGYLHVSNDGVVNVIGHTDNKYKSDGSTVDFYAGDFIINGVATFDNTDSWVKYTKVSCDNGTDKPGTLNIVNGANAEMSIHNGTNTKETLLLYKTGVLNVDKATVVVNNESSIAEKATVNVTDVTFTANGKMTNNGTFNVSGESTLNIKTLEKNTIDFLNGAIIKDSTIGGNVYVLGIVTFRGDNTFNLLYDYGTAYSDPGAEWTVEPGASVSLLAGSRHGLGYGDKVTIKGELTDAMTARENLTREDASLYMNGGTSMMDGWDKKNYLTVENAYVIIGQNNSFGTKADYGDKGDFFVSFDNTVLDSSRVTVVAGGGAAYFTFNKSDAKVGVWHFNHTGSTATFTDSVLVATGSGNDYPNVNAGEMTLVNSDIEFKTGVFTNNGTIKMDTKSLLTASSLAGSGKIIIDASEIQNADIGASVQVIKSDADVSADLIEVINGEDVTVDYTKGVTLTRNATVAYVVDENGEVIGKADTVAEAIKLAVAKGSSLVKLSHDVDESMVMVNRGITLDLNGNTLDADYLVVFNGSSLVDNSTEKGLLKIAKDNISLPVNNAQMPVWSEADGGYYFAKVEINKMQMVTDYQGGLFQVITRPDFAGLNDYFADGAVDNNIQFMVRLSWVDKDGNEVYQNFMYNEDLVKQIYGQNKAFYLYINSMGSIKAVDIHVLVVSNTGVQQLGNTMKYPAP